MGSTRCGGVCAREIEGGKGKCGVCSRVMCTNQEAYARLRASKGEVERMQRLVEQGRQRVQAEFEAWFVAAKAAQQEQEQEQRRGMETYEEKGEARRMSSSSSSSHSLSASTTERKAVVEERSLSLSSLSSSLTTMTMERAASTQQPKQPKRRLSSSTPSIASASDVEDDIAAFYRAKEELMAMRRQGRA